MITKIERKNVLHKQHYIMLLKNMEVLNMKP